MTKVKDIVIENFYRHMSVQSVLDMKENYGRVDVDILREMNQGACASFAIKATGRAVAIIFVFDAKEVYNIIVYTGGHFTRHRDRCGKMMQEFLEPFKTKECNAIVYRNANTLLSVFAKIGFMPAKEKGQYKILERIK